MHRVFYDYVGLDATAPSITSAAAASSVLIQAKAAALKRALVFTLVIYLDIARNSINYRCSLFIETFYYYNLMHIFY